MGHRVLLRLPVNCIRVPASPQLARVSPSRAPDAGSAAEGAELVRSSGS